MTDQDAERDGDDRGDPDRRDRVSQVLQQQLEGAPRAGPVRRVQQVLEDVHAARRLLAQVSASSWISRISPSATRASSTLSTRPTMIGVKKLLLKPRSKSWPRAPLPTTAATLTSAMLDTVTTRRPAKMTGIASGSSTSRSRRNQPNPIADADCLTAAGTDHSPSTTLRTSSATE